MKVYAVMILSDYEYEGRDIYGIYKNRKSAQQAIKEEGQEMIDCSVPLYTIEEYELKD